VPLATIYTYPWDLDDEGVESALDVIQETAGLNGVSLAASYHISTYFLPHNPRRQIYFGEDGMVLFDADETRYVTTRLRPRTSHLVDRRDYLSAIAQAVRRRGLELTAWIVYCYNHYQARNYPECAKIDALGNHNHAQLCPSNPDVRNYFRELTREILDQTAAQAVHIESLGFLRFDYGILNPKILTEIAPFDRFLLGLCFCPHCVAATDRGGVEGDRLRREVAAHLERSLPEEPVGEARAEVTEERRSSAFGGALDGYLTARADAVTGLYEEVAQLLRARNVRVECGAVRPGRDAVTGLIGERVLAVTDRIASGFPGSGREAEIIRAQKQAWPPHVQLLPSIQGADLNEGGDLLNRLRACREAGADGFTFYNYGLLRSAQLRRIGEAREAWE
jgi:hypothetical protein